MMVMIMDKPASTQYPILQTVADRWSPRAFSTQAVEPEKLCSVFEAARWAASCFNDQPWTFIVATQADSEAYQQLLNCLMPGNVVWAQQAPVLIAAIAQETFKHNSKPNGWAQYDLGQSVATLVLEATRLGLRAHQMAGFEPDKVISTFNLAPEFKPMAMVALGYAGDPNALPDDLKTKELAPRTRRDLSDFVFSGQWGHPAPFLTTS